MSADRSVPRRQVSSGARAQADLLRQRAQRRARTAARAQRPDPLLERAPLRRRVGQRERCRRAPPPARSAVGAGRARPRRRAGPARASAQRAPRDPFRRLAVGRELARRLDHQRERPSRSPHVGQQRRQRGHDQRRASSPRPGRRASAARRRPCASSVRPARSAAPRRRASRSRPCGADARAPRRRHARRARVAALSRWPAA